MIAAQTQYESKRDGAGNIIVTGERATHPDVTLPPEWMRDAACADHADIFEALYPKDEDTTGGVWRSKDYRDSVTACRDVCNACPVRGECLSFALERESAAWNQHRYGMFGGLTPSERKAASRNSRADLDARRVEAVLQYAEGATLRDVSRAVGLGRDTVRELVKRAGVYRPYRQAAAS